MLRQNLLLSATDTPVYHLFPRDTDMVCVWYFES